MVADVKPDWAQSGTNVGASSVEQVIARVLPSMVTRTIGADCTPMVDGDFLTLVNAWWEPLAFTVPADLSPRQWSVVCDTYDPARKVSVAQELAVGPRSIVILTSPSNELRI
jgi:isoamylase